jgi:hypothetical protein
MTARWIIGPGTGTGTSPRPGTKALAARVSLDMPGWTSDTRRLTRTAVLPPGYDRTVLDQVHKAEQDLVHRAEIEPGPALHRLMRVHNLVSDVPASVEPDFGPQYVVHEPH